MYMAISLDRASGVPHIVLITSIRAALVINSNTVLINYCIDFFLMCIQFVHDTEMCSLC